ncbi:hypothetical protein, variant 1 [Exophiala xenobiotica]|uniref:Zn(2)-C6 fungal-type domain-containing protein n=1 Tax=Exophiala xenobiotica TaxID=348802 RepID=A0A0D2CMR8_9EURO|nr:hypothetical protein, variant 1 [Exophiala xenobiotica]KIW51172.1 hypothetical protein, variant 1 [Exophiala xenobiotica]
MHSPPKALSIQPAKERQPLKPTTAKKRQSSARISAACEACKRRRTKCTGGPPPCKLCENLGTECVIGLSFDMRRRAALQRMIDESRSYQETLNRLMDSIREGPSPRLTSLYDIIKSSGSNQDSAAAIQHYLRDSDEQSSDHTMISNGDIVESPLPDGAGKVMSRDGDLDSPSASGGASLKGDEIDSQKIMEPPSRVGSVPLQLAKAKQRSETPNIEWLLMALKSCSISDGEEMLRRFVASEMADKGSSSPCSTASGRSLFEKFQPIKVQDRMAERSKWHPALQLRSPTVFVEEKSQIGQGAHSDQRRLSGADASMVRPEQSKMRSQPVSRRPSFPQPQINTDIPMLSMRQFSPTAPYLEHVSTPESSSSVSNGWDLTVAQEDQSTRLRIPRHLVLPLTIADDSYMSRTYTHYLQGARQMLETGVPLSNVLGVDDEVPVNLFFRSRTDKDQFDCASWACEVTRSYETDVFARLGTAYMLTFMMRWLLVPTVENYQKVPDMMKPTPSQCMIPHIGAIETIPM